jgi:hypothetical protein
MLDSKIEIHLKNNSAFFIGYITFVALILNLYQFKYKKQKNKVLVSFKNKSKKEYFDFKRLCFKPYNLF